MSEDADVGKDPELSVVIPVYNEEAILRSSVEELHHQLSDCRLGDPSGACQRSKAAAPRGLKQLRLPLP